MIMVPPPHEPRQTDRQTDPTYCTPLPLDVYQHQACFLLGQYPGTHRAAPCAPVYPFARGPNQQWRRRALSSSSISACGSGHSGICGTSGRCLALTPRSVCSRSGGTKPTKRFASSAYSPATQRPPTSKTCVLVKTEPYPSGWSVPALPAWSKSTRCLLRRLAVFDQCVPGYLWCVTCASSLSTLICPLRMVVESTFSLVASVGSMKACHDQLAIMSSMTCSMRG